MNVVSLDVARQNQREVVLVECTAIMRAALCQMAEFADPSEIIEVLRKELRDMEDYFSPSHDQQ